MTDVTGSKRSVLAAVVAGLALLSTVVGAGGAGASPDVVTPAAAVPDLAWSPCGTELPGYDCATVTVPLDHDRPSGETTQLALARFPAADPDHRVGTVFFNPGGPRGSGVGLVLDGFGEFLGNQLDGRFDIVGFDPGRRLRPAPLLRLRERPRRVPVPAPTLPLPPAPVPPVLPHLGRAGA